MNARRRPVRRSLGGGGSPGGGGRIAALALKDARELSRNPGAIFPAVAMMFGSLFPAFLLAIGVPMFAGKSLEEDGEFADMRRRQCSPRCRSWRACREMRSSRP